MFALNSSIFTSVAAVIFLPKVTMIAYNSWKRALLISITQFSAHTTSHVFLIIEKSFSLSKNVTTKWFIYCVWVNSRNPNKSFYCIRWGSSTMHVTELLQQFKPPNPSNLWISDKKWLTKQENVLRSCKI